jgi:hypothetical protein
MVRVAMPPEPPRNVSGFSSRDSVKRAAARKQARFPPHRAGLARHAPALGAFQFLSADASKPHPQPFSLHTAAVLTGEKPGNAAGSSKTEMHPPALKAANRCRPGASVPLQVIATDP